MTAPGFHIYALGVVHRAGHFCPPPRVGDTKGPARKSRWSQGIDFLTCKSRQPVTYKTVRLNCDTHRKILIPP